MAQRYYTADERRKLALAVLVILPLAGWGIAVHFTENLPRTKVLLPLYQLLIATPDKPVLLGGLCGGLLIGLVAAYLIDKGPAATFRGAAFRRHLRGTRAVTAAQLTELTKQRKVKQMTIAGIPMPMDAENLHLLIGGGTGAGKTTLFRELALGALHRGDKVICLDPGGAMLSKFFVEGDVVLNPYDERSEGWSFFNEIRHDYDFQRFALSLVPRGRSADAEEWASYGRLLLRETARKLQYERNPSVAELFRWTTIVPPDQLQTYLTGTLAESLFTGSSEATRALSSARFVLSDKLPEHVTMPGGDFSLRDWLAKPGPSTLWITWREDMAPALRPLISAWTDTLFVSILSMPEDAKRRVWIFIDELASLEKLATLEDALTKGRKHGLRVVAGLQSTAQLNDIYGREEAKTLRSCFSSMVVMRTSKTDPETAEDFSRSLGEHEVERIRESSSTGGRGAGRSNQVVHERERVVSPSELTSLPNLTGYLAITGDLPIARFTTKYREYPGRAAAFIERSIR